MRSSGRFADLVEPRQGGNLGDRSVDERVRELRPPLPSPVSPVRERVEATVVALALEQAASEHHEHPPLVRPKVGHDGVEFAHAASDR